MSMSSNGVGDEPPFKKPKPSGPTSFVTWNANGLTSRLTWNQDQVIQMIQACGGPDVLCLQEVRLKAAGPHNRGTPLASSDYKSIQNAVETTVFGDHKCWSLADTKYAGTLTLLNKRLRFSKQDAAFCMGAAISLLLRRFHVTREDAGLPLKPKRNNSKRATNAAQTATKKKKQATMTSFFAPKATPPKDGTVSLTLPSTTQHQEEGRFQFFCLDRLDLINTYVPNNGIKEESFQRRRDWDDQIQQFLVQRKLILKETGAPDRPLLWTGDMKVAKDYRDGTHWERAGDDNKNNNKTSNSDEPMVYEWWKDESRCFVVGMLKNSIPTDARAREVSRALRRTSGVDLHKF